MKYNCKIEYALPSFKEPVYLFDPDPPAPWWVIALKTVGILFLLAFLVSASIFFYLFPAQLVWLVLVLPWALYGFMFGMVSYKQP